MLLFLKPIIELELEKYGNCHQLIDFDEKGRRC